MILEMMHDGGPAMVPTLIVGATLVALSVKFAHRPERRYLPLLVALNWLTLTAGALGFVTGIMRMCAPLAGPGIAESGRIAFEGVGESASALALALLLVVMAGVASAVGAWRFPEPAARAS